MRLLRSALALLVVLAVPLVLAVAAQGLAERPGPPSVPSVPVRLVDGAAGTGPSEPPAATPSLGEPRVVAPSGPGLADDVDDEDDDEDDGR